MIIMTICDKKSLSDISVNVNKKSDNLDSKVENQEKILCNYCSRTASNGIRCMGICVADNDY